MAKKKLTAKQRRMRAPVVPGSPVRFGDVLRDAFAEQRMRYGPVTSALRQHQTNAGNWFDQYKADLAAKGQRQQAAYTGAVQGVRDQAAAAQVASNQASAEVDAQMRADAAQRGAAYSGAPGQQAVAGTDVRKALTDAFANAIQGQGLSYGANVADQSTVGSAAQLSERLKGQKALEDLKREKGAFRSQYIAGRRSDEAKGVLERQAFGLDVAKFQQSQKPKPLSPSEKKTQRENSFFDKHGYWPSTGAPKPPASEKPPKMDVKTAANIRRGVQLVRNHDNGLDGYFDDAFNTLVEKDGFEPAIARAIVQGAKTGRIGPKTAEILHSQYGIDWRKLGIKRRPKKRPEAYVQPDTPGSDAAQGNLTASASRRSRPRNVTRYNTHERF